MYTFLFQETDPGWPPLIRIQPLIHWNYDNVWSFLRQFSIPYCCLYDKGYESKNKIKLYVTYKFF